MSKSKTTLGIEIGSQHLVMVWVRKQDNQLSPVNQITRQLDDSVIQEGKITNIPALTSIIKDILKKSKIKADKVAVALPGRVTLLQISFMPKPLPTNLREYLRDQVSQYAIMKNHQIDLDFCRIPFGPGQADNRILIGATHSEQIDRIISIFDNLGIKIDIIDSNLIAALKAGEHHSNIQNNQNYLLALADHNHLQICVLKDGHLDFIRSKTIDPEIENIQSKLSEELELVMEFYQVQMQQNQRQWNIEIKSSEIQNTELEQELQTRSDIKSVNLNRDYKIDQNSKSLKSSVAVGLAIDLLEQDKQSKLPKINLLPQRYKNNQSLKKQLLIAANIAAVILLLSVLIVGMINGIANRFQNDLKNQQYTNAELLIRQKEQLENQFKKLKSNLKKQNQVIKPYKPIKMAQVIEDIRQATPAKIQINTISGNEKEIFIEGMALSHQNINRFVNSLDNSPKINSASLNMTQKSQKYDSIIEYSISCKLFLRKFAKAYAD